ncbi:MAG TPA: dihydroorotase [Casimicrobiaceae bacterium]|jgi:dihydroorotase|nr:dihydroorotase [Casimicrobiaceae bacterium]
MKIEIRNGRLIDPKHGVDRKASLYVAAGKVAAVGEPPAGWHANRVLDAAGLVVCPGLIDLSARLREPGFEYKATLESEVAAAIAGGVTSLACPPDTEPPLDEPGLVEMLKHRARSLNQAHVYPIGALTVGLKGDTITEMGELAEAGCIAFSQADAALADTQVLLRALQYAATFGYRVWLRPQDIHLARGGVAHDGEVATRLGLAAIPAFAETIALDTIFELVRATGVHVHLARLSTHDGVVRVRAAKKAGLPVTCDVAIHHVHLCDVDIGWFNAHCHLIPPLRGTRDRAALRAGLIDGTVDLICSDHTPVDDDAKQLPFAEAEPGATALELLLPLTLKWAREEKLPLSVALDRITAAPARVLGLDAGHLAPGADADVCVFDPDLHWVVEPSALRSQGKNTPFLGLELSGKVRYTLVGGQVVHEA